MATCYIVGAGDFTPRELKPQAGDFLIAADGGYRALQGVGLTPNLLVGDFDSLTERPVDVPTLTFPMEKDDTDIGLALREGWERGYRRFVLYGCDGGRQDHFLANLQQVGGISRKGGEIRMVCEHCTVYGLTDGTLLLPPRERGTLVSVFCHGAQALGVTLSGLKYPLHEATLTCDLPLGVSNEYQAENASVTVREGTVLVFVYRQLSHPAKPV